MRAYRWLQILQLKFEDLPKLELFHFVELSLQRFKTVNVNLQFSGLRTTPFNTSPWHQPCVSSVLTNASTYLARSIKLDIFFSYPLHNSVCNALFAFESLLLEAPAQGELTLNLSKSIFNSLINKTSDWLHFSSHLKTWSRQSAQHIISCQKSTLKGVKKVIRHQI